ncbi:hypothetical protein D9M72_549700 [compost metagenome]
MRNRRRQILRVFIEPAQKDKDIVCGRAVHVIALRHFALVAGWQEEKLAALSLIRSKQTNVTEELATIDRDGTLPDIQQDALQLRRRFHHHRSIPSQVDVAHRVKDIGVGGRHQGLGIKSALPDRQDVVAGAECLFRAHLHAEGVDQRQRPEIRLRRPLKKQFVA